MIAGQYCGRRGAVVHEHRRRRQIAGEFVVTDDQLMCGILDALGADRYRRAGILSLVFPFAGGCPA